MELLVEISLENRNEYDILHIHVLDIECTPLRIRFTIEELKRTFQMLKKSKELKHFVLNVVCNNMAWVSPSNIKEVIDIFKDNAKFFKEKLICSFLLVDNKWMTQLTQLLMQFYTPVKPLFLIKELPVPHEQVMDVLNNKPLPNAFTNS